MNGRAVLTIAVAHSFGCSFCCEIETQNGAACLESVPHRYRANVERSVNAAIEATLHHHPELLDCLAEIPQVKVWIGEVTPQMCGGSRACVQGKRIAVDKSDSFCWVSKTTSHEYLHVISNQCLGNKGHGQDPFCVKNQCRGEGPARPEYRALELLGCLPQSK